MEVLIVKAGPYLKGTVQIAGAKNSALKLMAACLLVEGTSRLENVPRITDVEIMAELLSAMGVEISHNLNTMTLTTPCELKPEVPYELMQRMRASIVVLGPLLGRSLQAKVSMPGGDDFGHRPIDIHLNALRSLGAEITTTHGYIQAKAKKLIGAKVILDYPSHTATENVLMAAVLARGTTVIENAAKEPEVQDLAEFLTQMGAHIAGAGTSRIEVEGVDNLCPAMHSAIPDRVETATFLAALGLAGGKLLIKGTRADHMDILLEKLAAMGITLTVTKNDILAEFEEQGSLQPVDVHSLPYPGIATDYMPFLVTMLSVAKGISLASENLFPGRFRYIDELIRMGANIRLEGHHIAIKGVDCLSAARVRAPDLRGGAALVLAGLTAQGETTVEDIFHIDRGYEYFDKKLAMLGADVQRIKR